MMRSQLAITREVALLTKPEKLFIEIEAAQLLEKLLDLGRDNNAIQGDIHKFSICFMGAQGNLFTMPGEYWRAEFERRIGRSLKAVGIKLETGKHGADSVWDVQIYNPRMEERKRRDKGHA